MHSFRVALLGALVVASALSACSLFPCTERRHDSGLLLVCAERVRDIPENLKAAASDAWSLAEDHPDALGFPWANPDTGELEMRVIDSSGEAVVRDWVARGVARTTTKPAQLARPSVAVKIVTSERSFRQLLEIQNGSLPANALPDGDAIYEVGPDVERNAIVFTIDRLSDSLLRALATRYGTSAIVIRVAPDRPQTGF